MSVSRTRELTHLNLQFLLPLHSVEMSVSRTRELTHSNCKRCTTNVACRNECIPYEGIDTMNSSSFTDCRLFRRNECIPYEGIDTPTFFPSL